MAIERLHKPASARGLRKQATGSADFGAIPKPTVTVRMKESAKCGHARALRHERAVCLAVSCALIQETCFQRHTMSQINDLPLSAITASNSSRGERIAFVEAQWHSDIVHQARDAFLEEMARLGVARERIDIFDVPGAFEIPLHAKRLANSGKYAAIIGCALVVDGGIYRHEFVANTVVSTLMSASTGDRRADLLGRAHAAPLPRARGAPQVLPSPFRDQGHRSGRGLLQDARGAEAGGRGTGRVTTGTRPQ
jgi:6,7-dimethyl-8-ribityllumazine synthase